MKYGWHGLRPTALMLKRYSDQQFWQTYTATALWMIGKALAGDSWTVNSYVEIRYPQQAGQDTRSAEQIKQDIIKRLEE